MQDEIIFDYPSRLNGALHYVTEKNYTEKTLSYLT